MFRDQAQNRLNERLPVEQRNAIEEFMNENEANEEEDKEALEPELENEMEEHH